MRPFNIALLVLVLTVPQLVQAQVQLSSPAITGLVIDVDTGAPVSHVNVVAEWRRERNYVDDEGALIYVTETVTEKDGSYTIPAWGPIALPSRSDFRQGEDPVITIFKSGYQPVSLSNETVSDIRYRSTPLGKSKWAGATIKIRRWQGPIQDYWWRVNSMSGSLSSENRAWRRYPRMLVTLLKEQDRLLALGAPGRLDGLSLGRFTAEDREFLRGYEE